MATAGWFAKAFHDGQPNARPAFYARRKMGLNKEIEDMRHDFRWDACPIVADDNGDDSTGCMFAAGALTVNRDLYFTADGSVFRPVPKQIPDYLVTANVVPPD